MKYDFHSIIDRRGKDALAVDGIGTGWAPDSPKEGFDAIPMWVADMNFATAPSVSKAICERASHPTFGYFAPQKEYYCSIIRWHRERNGVTDLKGEYIGYENGVLGGMLSAMATFCAKGDSILVHSPTYAGFTGSLTNSGYRIVYSPLKRDENGVWRMDFEDMERKIADNGIHAAIFCSPHNPTGRVWERWEIERAMELYEKYDVYVVSDEIWSDIILGDNKHIPTQSVSEEAKNRVVALYSPSKTFNLAGLIGSYHIIYNKRLRDRIRKESSLCHYNNMNVLSMHALLGAYSDEGQEWVDELNKTLTENVDYAIDFINTHFEGLSVPKPQGTYMIFPDCTEWLKKHNKTVEELVKMGWDVGVAWQNGKTHGGTNEIRINLALPLSKVKEAFDRLDKYVFNSCEEK